MEYLPVFKSKNKKLSLRDSSLTYVDISPTLLKPDMTFYPGLWKNDNLHLNQNGYNKWSEDSHNHHKEISPESI